MFILVSVVFGRDSPTSLESPIFALHTTSLLGARPRRERGTSAGWRHWRGRCLPRVTCTARSWRGWTSADASAARGGEPPRNPTVLLIIWVWVDHVFVLILTHSLTEYHQQNRWSSIPCRYVSFRVRQRALLLKLMPKWKQPFGESPVKQLRFSRHFTQVFTVAGGTNATGDTDLQVWTGAVRLWLAEASSWMSRFASRRIRACEGILDPK